MKKIMFTGGGSAGHVTVNLALIPRFLSDGWSVVYVGSEVGIEKQLVTANNIRYIGISSGKLRRYFDLRNLSDPFRVLKGTMQAFRVIKKENPDVLFSKGGFVSVPVVLGAWLNKVPIIIHESDLTPGLANRISMMFAHTICTTFKESERYLPTGKTHYVGAVVREELSAGNPLTGKAFCNFADNKPILLIMGGSLGSKKINETIRSALTNLTDIYNIVHLCGRGNTDAFIKSRGYRQYEYLNEELPHVLAAADIVVSRAGSNSIFELLHLRKPMLLIPLTKEQSRGDQILNAQSFESSGFCRVLYEEQMTSEAFVNAVNDVYKSRQELIDKMMKYEQSDALSKVVELIKEVADS
jgi:UDP-N-acetylglucosamine--N-acetylmuramyl-(pentapeptide) pyrophosphoryl-undecaprenol N-acetylglucosamine transferase